MTSKNSTGQPVCPSVCLSVCLSVRPACLSVCLSVRPACLSVCLSAKVPCLVLEYLCTWCSWSECGGRGPRSALQPIQPGARAPHKLLRASENQKKGNEHCHNDCRTRSLVFRQGPYHAGSTSSRPLTEVKQRWVRIVLRWVTAWEHRMSLASFWLFRIKCR